MPTVLQAQGLSTYGTFPWNLKFTELEPLGKPEHSSLPIPVKHCELELFHTAVVYANAVIQCIKLVSEISDLLVMSKCILLPFVPAKVKLQAVSFTQ